MLTSRRFACHHDDVEAGAVPGPHRLVVVFQKGGLKAGGPQQPLQLRETDGGHGVPVVPAVAAAGRSASDAEHQLENIAVAAVMPARPKAQLAVPFREASLDRPAGGNARRIHRVEDEHAARLQGAPRAAQGFFQRGGGVAVMDRVEEAADQIKGLDLIERGQIAQQQLCLRYPPGGLGEHVAAVVESGNSKTVIAHMQQMLAGAAGQVEIVPSARAAEAGEGPLRKGALAGVIHFGAKTVVIAGKVGIQITGLGHG